MIRAAKLLNEEAKRIKADYWDVWPKLEASGMNTVLAVVEWSLVEPIEGNFDFTVVDNLIEDARIHQLRLVLLWFGAWKNG